MSENNEFTLISDDGQGSGNNTSVNPAEVSKAPADGAVDEGSKTATEEGKHTAQPEKSDVTGSFKERLDRMRRRERERSDAALKANNEAWEKRFRELEAKVNAGQAPKALKRDDFDSDEEFLKAKRQNAMEELMNAMDKRNAEKEAKANEEKAKANEAAEYQRKFAERFNTRMKETLSEEQQKQALDIVNDDDSAVNVAMSSKGGETLQSWIMEDCENPADVLLYLEQNSGKIERLLQLSPRKQIAQLDMLERHLAKSRYEASLKKQTGGEQPNQAQTRKAPVIGQFGGSTQAVGDESQLSDQERVAKLIKAMRKR